MCKVTTHDRALQRAWTEGAPPSSQICCRPCRCLPQRSGGLAGPVKANRGSKAAASTFQKRSHAPQLTACSPAEFAAQLGTAAFCFPDAAEHCGAPGTPTLGDRKTGRRQRTPAVRQSRDARLALDKIARSSSSTVRASTLLPVSVTGKVTRQFAVPHSRPRQH